MSEQTLNWQNIYVKHSPKLLGICRRYVSDTFAAEDIVQDSFIVAIQKNGQLKDEKALFGWLKTIVVNNALQYLKKQNKENFILNENLEIPDTQSEMEQAIVEDKNIFVYDFTTEELLRSIDQLPDHHKSVFNLYFMENFSHTEISNTLGITVNTSKSHLLRAKKNVREFLLNQVVTENTPKNKIAQLLIFFGLGGLLWAQNFSAKFSNFNIQPQKKLEIPKEIVQGKISFSNAILVKKLTVIGSLLIMFLTFILMFTPIKFPILSFQNNISKNILYEDKNEKLVVKKETNPTQTNKNNIKTINHKNIKNEITKTQKENNNSLTKLHNPTKKTPKKDTLNEKPHQIVIVKKIIKRDTIFVEN